MNLTRSNKTCWTCKVENELLEQARIVVERFSDRSAGIVVAEFYESQISNL